MANPIFEGEYWENIRDKMDEVYSQAAAEMQEKLENYLARFAKYESQMKDDLEKGKITQQEYNRFMQTKIYGEQYWVSMRDTLAKDLTNTNRMALAYVNGFIPKAYTAGYNEISKEDLRGYSFALVDEATVRMLMNSNKTLLPYLTLKDGSKEVRWNTKQINSAVLQGILQGESLQKIAARMAKVCGSAEGRWLTNARTAVNSAENRGRQSSSEKMDDDGVLVYKEWISSLDLRTRDSHKFEPIGVGGEVVKYDEEFSNGLMYPCDPDGDPEEVYGCRCTMGAEIKGFKHKNYSKARASREEKVRLGNQIYDKQEEIANFLTTAKNGGDWEYAGIWKEPVTLADYESKKDSIQAKLDYFESQMNRYPVGSEEWNKFHDLYLKTLDYRTTSEAYLSLWKDRETLLQKMAYLDNLGGAKVGSPFGVDAYSQERKDAALWFTSPRSKSAADREFRDVTGEAWRSATDDEKNAIYDYTASYSKFNEPLRGIVYGQSTYVGVGKIDFDKIGVDGYGGFQQGYVRKRINDMTKIIDRSPLPKDAWFNRGCSFRGMDKFFQCNSDILMGGSQSELEKALLGKNIIEYGFMSTSSVRGSGFSGDIVMNIYAPKGTKAMYVEPFSAYGKGYGRPWDGVSKQKSFGTEFETIFQQGTEMRITKVERSNGTLYIDLEVIAQEKRQG